MQKKIRYSFVAKIEDDVEETLIGVKKLSGEIVEQKAGLFSSLARVVRVSSKYQQMSFFASQQLEVSKSTRLQVSEVAIHYYLIWPPYYSSQEADIVVSPDPVFN